VRYRRYKVALVGFDDDQPKKTRRSGRLVGVVGGWWALSWQRRLASIFFIAGVFILVLHFT
jgi:hypothetical protein